MTPFAGIGLRRAAVERLAAKLQNGYAANLPVQRAERAGRERWPELAVNMVPAANRMGTHAANGHIASSAVLARGRLGGIPTNVLLTSSLLSRAMVRLFDMWRIADSLGTSVFVSVLEHTEGRPPRHPARKNSQASKTNRVE